MGLYPDDEDELIPRVPKPSANDATAPATLRGLAPPGSTADLESRGGARAMPKAEPSPLQQQTTQDQALLQHYKDTGSGISQVKNPVGRGLLRGLETVGQVLLPGATPFIPGTEAHHNLLMRQQTGRIGEDLGEQQKQSTIEHTGAETEQSEAAAEKDRAEAHARLNPQPKEGLTPEETTIHDLMTGENGGPRLNPDTGKPFTYLEAFTKVSQAKQDTKPDKEPTFQEASFNEWKQTHPNGTRIQYEKELKSAERPPEREPHQLVVGPDGTVIELKPGMKVPAGSKTATKYGEPTADEQRRADLASNLNENLNQLEDIVTRRPELFGPLAGRWTELKGKFGSDDADIAALQVLEHQIGMAQISAHGMRSAQGIEGATHSILNGLHSGPNALKNAIGTVRNSVRTFTNDVATARGETPAQGSGPAIGTVEGGYKFKGGNPADQKNWEKVQ